MLPTRGKAIKNHNKLYMALVTHCCRVTSSLFKLPEHETSNDLTIRCLNSIDLLPLRA